MDNYYSCSGYTNSSFPVYKLLICGDKGVGKTNFFLADEESTDPTISFEYWVNQNIKIDGSVIKTRIWDSFGRKKFDSLEFKRIFQVMINGCVGVCLVYSVGDRKSFLSCTRWVNLIRKFSSKSHVDIVLVGNSRNCSIEDIPKIRKVSTEEARTFAKQYELMFVETSTFDRTNINFCFSYLVKKIYDRERSEKLNRFYGPPDLDFKFVEKYLVDKKLQSRDSVSLIEEGAYGAVFRVNQRHFNHNDDNVYALKVFKRNGEIDEMMNIYESRETRISSVLNHKNVARLVGVSTKPKGLVYEYFHQSIYQVLTPPSKTFLTFEKKLWIVLELCLGMEYIHANEIVHRDLKWSNVMISHPINHPLSEIKIIDFGLSRTIDSFKTKLISDVRLCCCDKMAPELVGMDYIRYPTKIDIFSFGIMLYELFLGKIRVYPNSVSTLINVKEGMRPDISKLPSNTPDWILELMVKCWNENPKKRPSFDNIVQEVKSHMVKI